MELSKLRFLLNKNNNVNTDSEKIFKNDIIVVNFNSMDGNINYGIAAEKKDLFAEIEEKLYQQYPQYRETNNNFIANGAQILRFKTIEQNKIQNGIPVTLKVIQ